MTKQEQERERTIEELKLSQAKYLETVSEYYSPEDRKELIEMSMSRFEKYLTDAESGALSNDDLVKVVDLVKKGVEDAKFPKGTCSMGCVRQMLMTQDFVVASAARSELPKEAFLALLELSNNVTENAIAAMLVLAESPDKPWKVRQKVHDILQDSTKSLEELRDMVKSGRVLTVRLPPVDSSKYKQFMN